MAGRSRNTADWAEGGPRVRRSPFPQDQLRRQIAGVLSNSKFILPVEMTPNKATEYGSCVNTVKLFQVKTEWKLLIALKTMEPNPEEGERVETINRE